MNELVMATFVSDRVLAVLVVVVIIGLILASSGPTRGSNGGL